MSYTYDERTVLLERNDLLEKITELEMIMSPMKPEKIILAGNYMIGIYNQTSKRIAFEVQNIKFPIIINSYDIFNIINTKSDFIIFKGGNIIDFVNREDI